MTLIWAVDESVKYSISNDLESLTGNIFLAVLLCARTWKLVLIRHHFAAAWRFNSFGIMRIKLTGTEFF